jgi:hypothetical protein
MAFRASATVALVPRVVLFTAFHAAHWLSA